MENREAFFALIRAGLWEYGELVCGEGLSVNGSDMLRLAEEQSVIGLMVTGVEKLKVYSIPLAERLTLLGKCQLIEQRNVAMNSFVAGLVQKLHETGVKAVLVKGPGIAQCYAKPLLRLSGDVDLLLDEENYRKARRLLLPMATETGTEFEYDQHQSLTIGSYTVELHGSQCCGLSGRMDCVIDEVQREVCQNGKVRTWMNGNVPINLPAPDEDVVFVFTHFFKHFYKGGIGLRQICDWCRLLWTYRDEIDKKKIEGRIRRMGLVSEWKAFYNLASRYLGMPNLDSSFMFHDSRYDKKADRIMDFILKSGNMGHNRDMNHFNNKPYLTRKCISMGRRIGDLINHARIFPMDSLRFFPGIMWNGMRSAMRGE